MQFHLETTLDSARAFVAHGADDLVGGRYVQTAHAMLADGRRLDSINRVMHDFLDRLEAGGPERITPSDGESIGH